MAGLNGSGFTPKRLDEIESSIKTSLRSKFGSGLDADSQDSIIKLLISNISVEIDAVWQGQERVYNNFNPNGAEGVALDNIGAITGTTRGEATFSTVDVDASGTEGSAIPNGFQLSVTDTGEIFQTKQSYVLPAAGSQPLSISMTALNSGPVVALAGTLTGTLPAGVTSMTNPSDAQLGKNAETDEEYRVSRIANLAKVGAGTVPAIKASLLDTTGVTKAIVFENDTDITDSNGVPPHSIEALVSGGADQDIINTLGIKKGAGTRTHGNVSGIYTDPADGQTFTIKFSRATLVSIYVKVDILTKDSNYPGDGDTQIQNAILAIETELDIGDDVLYPRLQNAVTSVPGILTYDLFVNKTGAPITETANIPIASTEQADFDSSRITVTS